MLDVLLASDTAGQFVGPTQYFNTGRGSYAVVAGDFNGDGRADVVVANHDDADISVRLNTETTEWAYDHAHPLIARTPWTTNQTIEAENYNVGGQGVAYSDTTATDDYDPKYRTGGVDLGADASASNGEALIAAYGGEYVDYTVNVPTAGTYSLQARVANVSTGGTFDALFNGTDKSGAIAVPNTTSYTAYTTVSQTVTLSAGVQVMRIQMNGGGEYNASGNFDWFKLVPATPPPSGGSIAGTVFKDSDGDGVKDSNETGLSGVAVYLDADNDSVKDSSETSVTTDSSGNYKFTGLAAATYKVRQVLPGGYGQSLPSGGVGIGVTLTSGQAATGKNFGDKPAGSTSTGTLSGFVFDDADKDGVYDSGENRPSGKTVFLDLDNDGVLDSGEKSVTTGTNGAWSFSGLAAGTYHVRRVFSSGYSLSTPKIDVTLSAGQSVSGLSIGSKSGTSTPVNNGSISGFAFDDKNKNGLFDTGDGLAIGKTIYLDLDDDGVRDANEPSVVTDSAGKFNFTGLAARSYHVRRVFSTGYSESTPARRITLTAGQSVTGVGIGSKAN